MSERRYYTRCCGRCGGVGWILQSIIGGKVWPPDGPKRCWTCRGEGVCTYIALGMGGEDSSRVSRRTRLVL